MRLGKRSFRAQIKSQIHLEFGDDRISSYAGLEIFRRYLLNIGFVRRLRHCDAEKGWRGDLRFASVVMLVVGAVLVGARRLRHLEYLEGDPLVHRFAEMPRLPRASSISRALKKMSMPRLVDIDEISRFVVCDGLSNISLPRVTLDIDGSVVTTGQKVGGATRGYNPHNRKNPSYYPITVMLAQTGHVWAQRNRPGGVHDSHDADATLRNAVGQLRDELGHRGIVELRADSAFFAQHVLEACDSTKIDYAIKVPMCSWLDIKTLIKKQQIWTSVSKEHQVEGFFACLPIDAWNRTERVAILRTRRSRKPAKGFQLDLFNPDDGYWEHSVIASNKSLGLSALWKFMNGRGAQEKTIAELKSGFAYDSVVTNNETANAAWQKMAVLAHNISISLQLSCAAPEKLRSAKRTTAFLIKAIATIRFEWLNRAARIIRPQGRLAMRLSDSPMVREHYEKLDAHLAAAA